MNCDLLIDRILVALLQKKPNIMENCFAGRAMLESASAQDENIRDLSQMFSSILYHENFIEFNTSPIQKKVPLMAQNSELVPSKLMVSSPMMTQNERRVKQLLEKLGDLSDKDQNFFMTKIDSISKDIEDHIQTVKGSPNYKIQNKNSDQGTGNIKDDDFGKLWLVITTIFRHSTKNIEWR